MTAIITSSLGSSNSITQSLGVAADEGYGTVQLTWLNRALKEHSPVEVAGTIRAALGDIRIAALCVGHDKNADYATWRATAEQHIDLARELTVNRVTEHARPYEGSSGFASTVRDIVGYGAVRGVRYGLETQTETLDQMQRLATEIPGLGFCFDPANLVAQGWTNPSVIDAVGSLGDRVLLVHVKDWSRAHGFDVPLGGGNVDLGGFLRHAQRHYDGPLVIEDSGSIGGRLERSRESRRWLDRYLLGTVRAGPGRTGGDVRSLLPSRPA